MPELTEVITTALNAATAEPADTGDTGDTGGETETAVESAPAETTAESVASTDESPAKEEPAPAKAAAQPEDENDLSKELEALGIKHIAGKDNRMPHSRVVKIVDNAKKKVAAEYEQKLKDQIAQYEQAQRELENFRAVDQIIQSDPERYLTLLSGYVPAYQRFLQKQEAAPAQTITPAEKMPQPDVKFPDGSPGYSPEQQQKLFDWIAAQAEERAVKRVEQQYQQRLAPIEQRFKAEQVQQQLRTQAQQQIANLHEAWGKELVDKHETEIVKYMQEHPKLPFDVCAAKVLLPKLQADRTRQREELLKELEARPKAAAPTPSAPAKTVSQTGPRSLEEIIKEQVAALR